MGLKREWIIVIVFFSILTAVLFLVGCKTSTGLVNFRQVEPGIYRGGQPDTEGWKVLKAMGVSNVIKLNPITAKASDYDAWRAGLTVYSFPINTIDQTLGVPDKTNVLAAVSMIKPGTYVHCLHGQDRTGLIIALYRVKTGWTKADAEKEMKQLGFHVWLRGLYWYWQENVK